MVPPLYIGLIMMVIIQSGTGIALNMSIFIFNIKSLKRRQKPKSCDLIYLAKGLVNALMQLCLTFDIIMALVNLHTLFMKEVYMTCFIIIYATGVLDYWLTSFLCAYYCLTICNLRFTVFIWMKRSIKMFLPQLLLLAAVGSLLLTVPSIWETSVTFHKQSIWNSTNNSMTFGANLFIDPFYIIPAGILGCFFPFSLTVLSLQVTIITIIRHIWKIRNTNSCFKGPKLQVLINAARTMLLLLAVHVSFYLSGQFSVLSLCVSLDVMSIISWFFVVFCPTAESFIIIQASSKLREIFHMVVCSRKKENGNVDD